MRSVLLKCDNEFSVAEGLTISASLRCYIHHCAESTEETISNNSFLNLPRYELDVSRLKDRTLTAISACLFVLKSLIRMLKHFFSVLKFKPMALREDHFKIPFPGYICTKGTDEVELISLGMDGAHLCWVTEPSVACEMMQ